MTPKSLRLHWTHPAFHLLIATLLLLVNGDADFLDVRTRLDRDRSGKGGDPKEKYFHESTFHPHYDGRFSNQVLAADERLPHLTDLIRTFLAAAADIGIEVWLMHGSLLGWWWNQKILPWDSDLDLQVSEQTIAFLAKYYNMTEYHFRLPANKRGRTYLLEVNPRYNFRKTEDKLNVIDARWIDTDTGLFIDISTVRVDRIARAQGVKGALMCKDKHRYLEKDMFPLRDSYFEGVHVKIPFEYTSLLEKEYGKKSLYLTKFQDHMFNSTTKLWEPITRPNRPVSNHPPHNMDRHPGQRQPEHGQ